MLRSKLIALTVAFASVAQLYPKTSNAQDNPEEDERLDGMTLVETGLAMVDERSPEYVAILTMLAAESNHLVGLQTTAEEMDGLHTNFRMNVLGGADIQGTAEELKAMIGALAMEIRSVDLSVDSIRRYQVLAEHYRARDGEAYRAYLLETIALMRNVALAGHSMLPTLMAMEYVVTENGSWDGLQSTLLFALDHVAREEAVAARHQILDGIIGQIRSALGVGNSTFISGARNGRWIIASFPFAVPLGRGTTNAVIELRPDLLDRLLAKALDMFPSGFPGMPGWLNPMAGLDDFVGALSPSDCVDLPSFAGLTSLNPYDATGTLSDQESVFGQPCGGGSNGTAGSGGSGGPGGLGDGLGAGITNVCVNGAGLDGAAGPDISETEAAIRTELATAQDCFRRHLDMGGGQRNGSCRLCSGGTGTSSTSQPRPSAPQKPKAINQKAWDNLTKRSQKIIAQNWAKLSDKQKNAVHSLLAYLDSASDYIDQQQADDLGVKIINSIIGWLPGGSTPEAMLNDAMTHSYRDLAQAQRVAAMAEQDAVNVARGMLDPGQTGIDLPGTDGPSPLDCDKYVNAMRQRLLNFDRYQFVSRPAPISTFDFIGGVDACDQRGLQTLQAGCDRMAAMHCADPADCCRGAPHAGNSTHRTRQGNCTSMRCAEGYTPVSDGIAGCTCMPLDSNTPTFPGPGGSTMGGFPTPRPHDITMNHAFGVDLLLGNGDWMSSAAALSSEQENNMAIYLRGGSIGP